MNRFHTILFLIIIILFGYSCTGANNADLVIRGGQIVTVDKDFSIQEAVAVRSGKIIYVGSDDEIQSYISRDTKLIELQDAIVLPGLIDAHGHLTGYGKALEYVDLVGTTSYQEIINLIKEKVETVEPGEWIRGRGWDQNDWTNKEFPEHQLLSAITPDNPVVLTRIDGHAILTNQLAMDLAGITLATPEIAGGKIHRDVSGNPTGVFVDNAEKLIAQHIPKYSQAEIRKIIKNGAEHLVTYGITGIHDAGIPISRISDYKYLIDKNAMPLRINAMLSDTSAVENEEFLRKHGVESYGDGFLRVKSIKLYADGALGSRGAALLKPYADDPDNMGLMVTDSLHILEVARAALQNDFQICTHAIGDRGIRTVLNVYENSLAATPKDDHRFRIEHSQIVNLADVTRFAELGVIPAMQPQHAISDMPWVAARIGTERSKGAYAWRSFIDAGLIIPCGSDVPVEVPDPLLGIYNAVTRQNEAGLPDSGWIPEQKMTIAEAIKGYTIWAAEAAFQEDILGSIETGKYADFTILDKNLLRIDPSEILDTNVLYTIVGGEIKYQAD